MIRAIAIDDEPKAISIIRHHVAASANLDLVATFNDPEKALSFLATNAVDLIFLDINMPKLSGMQLLGQLEEEPFVIITSAYADYALESYSFKTVDYLLKPFELDRFQKALSKVEERLSLSENPPAIFIKDGYKNVRVNPSDILFIKSDGNYLDVHLENQKLSPRMTFSELLALLPEGQFLRVHNSYVVNLDKVEKLQSGSVVLCGQSIPVSNSYKDDLLNKIKS